MFVFSSPLAPTRIAFGFGITRLDCIVELNFSGLDDDVDHVLTCFSQLSC
jgi:hypothetical protein